LEIALRLLNGTFAVFDKEKYPEEWKIGMDEIQRIRQIVESINSARFRRAIKNTRES
jgi:hypothetical protein